MQGQSVLPLNKLELGQNNFPLSRLPLMENMHRPIFKLKNRESSAEGKKPKQI